VGAGTDVWTKNLSEALEAIGIETVIRAYPHHFQYYPFLIKEKRTKDECDIVHVNSWNGFVFHDRDIPLLVTGYHVVHDKSFERYKSLPQKVFHGIIYHYEKRSFAAADHVTSISDFTRDMIREKFGVESRRIYCGIDENKFYPSEKKEDFFGVGKDKTVLLFTGNLIKRKGADLLPLIMNRLGDKFVLFCTSGLRKNRVRISDNIHIIGNIKDGDLADYYRNCDIFLFPTRLEGFGLGVCEAMACAKPVVSTGYSSIPELVINGKGGYLCGIDDIDGYVDRIRCLAADSGLRRRMGDFNRERVEKYFTIKKMAGEYAELYSEMIK